MEKEVSGSVLGRAWRTLMNCYVRALGVGFVYFVALCIVCMLIGLYVESLAIKDLTEKNALIKIVQGFAIFLLAPLFYGVSIFSLYAVRRDGPKFSMLFKGFGDFERIAGTLYLRGIYLFLWGLLFVIPGLIKSYSYAMTPFLLYDHPELKFDEAIERSKEMMYGNKGSLFAYEILLAMALIVPIFLLVRFVGLLVVVYGISASVLGFVLVLGFVVSLIMFSQVLYAEFYEMLKEEKAAKEKLAEPESEQTSLPVEPESPKPEASQGGYAKDYH